MLTGSVMQNAVEEKPKEAAPKDDVKVTNHGGGTILNRWDDVRNTSNQGEKAKLQMLENVVCSSCVSSLSRLAMCMTYLENNAVSQREPAAITLAEETSTRTT